MHICHVAVIIAVTSVGSPMICYAICISAISATMASCLVVLAYYFYAHTLGPVIDNRKRHDHCKLEETTRKKRLPV